MNTAKHIITKGEASRILFKYIKQDYLIKHSLETEAIMRALARHFGEDEELWGVTGLLHDLDMEEIGEDYSKHGLRTCELLKQEGYDIPDMFQAIKAHTEALGYLGIKRKTKLDFCLAAAENLTGLITAYALILPDKKLENVKPKSIAKRFKERAFAAKVNRDMIADIEKAGVTKEELFEIGVNALKGIAKEIGF